MAETHIHQVGAVFVPVTDQERALRFYVETLGFETRADFVYGGAIRWIEVAPPGAANTIALVAPGEGKAVGGDETYCAFATTDIESDTPLCAREASMLTRRSPAPAPVGRAWSRLTPSSRIRWPPQFFFRDVDGNRFLIVGPG